MMSVAAINVAGDVSHWARTESADAREQTDRAAEAILRRADALRAQAQSDADAARARIEEADGRARRLEDAARQRWEALREETEHRWDRLRAADRRLDDRVRQLERTLAALRSRATLLDQLTEVETLLSAIRAEARPDWAPADTPTTARWPRPRSRPTRPPGRADGRGGAGCRARRGRRSPVPR
jgi:chromosome segregation ATPase